MESVETEAASALFCFFFSCGLTSSVFIHGQHLRRDWRIHNVVPKEECSFRSTFKMLNQCRSIPDIHLILQSFNFHLNLFSNFFLCRTFVICDCYTSPFFAFLHQVAEYPVKRCLDAGLWTSTGWWTKEDTTETDDMRMMETS